MSAKTVANTVHSASSVILRAGSVHEKTWTIYLQTISQNLQINYSHAYPPVISILDNGAEGMCACWVPSRQGRTEVSITRLWAACGLFVIHWYHFLSTDSSCYLSHSRHRHDDLRWWVPQSLSHRHHFGCGLSFNVSSLQGICLHRINTITKPTTS